MHFRSPNERERADPVEPRAAHHLPPQHRDQEARDPSAGRTFGGQPSADVDLREVLLRGDPDPEQEEDSHLLHDQVDGTQSLLGQGGKLGAVSSVARPTSRSHIQHS